MPAHQATIRRNQTDFSLDTSNRALMLLKIPKFQGNRMIELRGRIFDEFRHLNV